MDPRVKRLLTNLLAALCLAAAPQASEAAGEIWVWTTPDGALHYTDDEERIPEAFRDSARLAQREGDGSYQRIPAVRASAPVPAGPAAQDSSGEISPETVWRDQAREIDARIAALAPEVERCKGDHVNLSPGDGSRKRRHERDEAQRCEQARSDLAAARAQRSDLEERARREGVPPGWVRSGD